MHSKKEKDYFLELRRHKKDAIRTPLYKSVKYAQDLELHLGKFMKCVAKDKNEDSTEVTRCIDEFEDALLEEFHEISSELKKDVVRTLGTLKKWSKLKHVSEEFSGKRHPLKETLSHDLRLAEELVKSIHTKIDSLEKIGRRMK